MQDASERAQVTRPKYLEKLATILADNGVMVPYSKTLQWVDWQKPKMKALVTRWASINSHTYNKEGLKHLTREVRKALTGLKTEITAQAMPPSRSINDLGKVESFLLAPSLVIRKRPQASKQALLVCHLDTVFPFDSPFQKVREMDAKTLQGPGVTDAKGGVVILLKGLEAFERSPLADRLGWTIVLNTDEEIGSPGSAPLLAKLAPSCQLGFVFEPCHGDGSLVGERKGSGNFTLVAHGRAAHAGRDHAYGRNALEALSKAIVQIRELNHSRQGLTLNTGVMHGGTAVNVVPDLATARLNIRLSKSEDQDYAQKKMQAILEKIEKEDEVKIQLHGDFGAPPKSLTGKTLKLHEFVRSCARDLGMSLDFKSSGGVCDGNRLNAAGLPTIDSMGAQGAHIHSPDEYLLTDSLTERAQLFVLALMKWADGTWGL